MMNKKQKQGKKAADHKGIIMECLGDAVNNGVHVGTRELTVSIPEDIIQGMGLKENDTVMFIDDGPGRVLIQKA